MSEFKYYLKMYIHYHRMYCMALSKGYEPPSVLSIECESLFHQNPAFARQADREAVWLLF